MQARKEQRWSGTEVTRRGAAGSCELWWWAPRGVREQDGAEGAAGLQRAQGGEDPKQQEQNQACCRSQGSHTTRRAKWALLLSPFLSGVCAY